MKSYKTNRIIFSVGAVIIGIVLLIWPETSLNIISRCIGIALAVGGLVAGGFFIKDHESLSRSFLLVMGVIMIICGVVIFLHPYDLVRLIPSIMGVLVLVSGIVNLMETFTLSKRKYSKWWVSLIISLITIGAGIFLVKYAFDLVAIITRIAGGILLFDGVSDLWVTSRVLSSSKESAVDGVIVSEENVPKEGTDIGPTQEAEAPKAEETAKPEKTQNADVQKTDAVKTDAQKAAEAPVKPQPAVTPEAPVKPQPKAASQTPAKSQPEADAEKNVKPQPDAVADEEKEENGRSETADSNLPEYMLYMDANNDEYDAGDDTP